MAAAQPERVAMRQKDLGIWHDIRWSEYLEKVREVALGLHALGVRKGDHVAIIGENQPEWLYSALGAMSAGATFVGIYTTNPVKECEYVVGHSGAVVYICEDEEQLDKALAFRENTPALRKMIVWDMEGLRDFHDPMVMSFDDLLALGRKSGRGGSVRSSTGSWRRGAARISPGSSTPPGTTGPPKGAMLAHEGYLWVGKQATAVSRGTRDDETISFLPLNHVYEQIYDLMVHLTIGHIINFTENTDTVMADMRDVSPTLFHAVPADLGEILFRDRPEDGRRDLVQADSPTGRPSRSAAGTTMRSSPAYSPSPSAEPRLSSCLLCRLSEAQGTARFRPGQDSDFPAPRPSPTTSSNISRASGFPSGKGTG